MLALVQSTQYVWKSNFIPYFSCLHLINKMMQLASHDSSADTYDITWLKKSFHLSWDWYDLINAMVPSDNTTGITKICLDIV